MMTARDEILARLGRNGEMPELTPRRREYPDLAEQFSAALTANGGEVLRAASKAEAVEQLAGLLAALDAERVAAHRTELADLPGIPEGLPRQRWAFAGEEADYRTFCARADVGITGAEAALAETGSLALVSGSETARMTSLLPPVHIVLLAESRIVPSLFGWVKQRPTPMPANLVLVNGPSKTADIEQTLIVGVHGPKRLIVIVYRQAVVSRW